MLAAIVKHYHDDKLGIALVKEDDAFLASRPVEYWLDDEQQLDQSKYLTITSAVDSYFFFFFPNLGKTKYGIHP